MHKAQGITSKICWNKVYVRNKMNIRPDLKMTKNRDILSINYTHYGPLCKKISFILLA